MLTVLQSSLSLLVTSKLFPTTNKIYLLTGHKQIFPIHRRVAWGHRHGEHPSSGCSPPCGAPYRGLPSTGVHKYLFWKDLQNNVRKFSSGKMSFSPITMVTKCYNVIPQDGPIVHSRTSRNKSSYFHCSPTHRSPFLTCAGTSVVFKTIRTS